MQAIYTSSVLQRSCTPFSSLQESLIQVISRGRYHDIAMYIRQNPGVLWNMAHESTHPVCMILKNSTLNDQEKYDITRLLLEHGLDVDSKDKKVISPLYEAIRCNDPKIVELLLSYNADPNQLDIYNNPMLISAIITKSQNTYTAICLDIFKLLIAYGADCTKKSSLSCSALNVAILNNRPDVIEELLTHKNADPNEIDPCGIPLMQLALTWLKNDYITSLFLHYGADPNAPDKESNSILFHLIRLNKIHLLNAFLVKGADPDKKNLRGETPFGLSMYNGNTLIFKALIQKKAARIGPVATICHIGTEYRFWANIPNKKCFTVVANLIDSICKGSFQEKKLLIEKSPDIISLAKEQKLSESYLTLLQRKISQAF